jgi:hypothetical protein
MRPTGLVSNFLLCLRQDNKFVAPKTPVRSSSSYVTFLPLVAGSQVPKLIADFKGMNHSAGDEFSHSGQVPQFLSLFEPVFL